MSAVGIVGGLGPESTIDYYRRILDIWQERDPDSSPSILIDSLDVNLGIRLVTNDHPQLARYLLASLDRLGRAGCTFAALAANTPHIVVDSIASKSPVPLLSIVEVCAEEVRRRDYHRVGLLGTGFTMAATFYPDVFSRSNIAVVVPIEHDRAWLHERYLGQLPKGDFRQDTRDGVEAIIKRLRTSNSIEAVVLAGTELPLLLKSDVVAGLPVLDTTELHVRAIVDRLKSESSSPAT
jgi:aspartate racemase